MTPTTTRRPGLASIRLARLAGSLREGLPGDGTPKTRAEAQRRCPHVTLRHKLIPDPQYSGVWLLRSWTEPSTPDPHACFGDWVL